MGTAETWQAELDHGEATQTTAEQVTVTMVSGTSMEVHYLGFLQENLLLSLLGLLE